MDDSDFSGFGADDRERASQAGDSDDQTLIVGIIHAACGFFLVYAIRWWCCRKKAEPQNGEAFTAEKEHLQPRKQLLSAYSLLVSGGLVGAHHFYLERLVHGLLAAWSCNFLFIGWLVDFFMMPSYVRGFNQRRSHEDAPPDRSRRQLWVKLPVMVIVFYACGFCFLLGAPWALHRMGVVDIDRLAAQTEKNPYDTLDIPHTANLAEAKTAYRKLSLKWHPDRNQGCGKECDHKMSEITKAFDLIKQRRAPITSARTWNDWLRDIGRDWWYVLEVLSAKWNNDEEKKPAPTKSAKKARPTKSKAKGKSEL